MKKLLFPIIGLFCCTFLFAGGTTPPTPPVIHDIYVDVNVAGGLHDGSSWEDAFLTIQEGIDDATSSDIVHVAAGTYNTGTTDTPGNLNSRVYINSGISVRSVDGAATTIIEGAADPISGNNGADAVRAVYITVGTLEGFTIRGGYTNISGDDVDRSGGGIYLSGGDVELCIINGNSADLYGGAAYFDGAGTLNSCLLTENTAPDGGAVFLDAGGTLNNCTLSNNEATSNGSGAYLLDGGTLNNCIVWGNSVTDIYDDGSNYIRYSCASDGLTNGVDGCTTSNPSFLDAGSANYRIYINSPCFNKGNYNYVYTDYDLDGEDRERFNSVDMGTYETKGVGITFTDGSTYSSSMSLGEDNQVFGRFKLMGDDDGASLTNASIRLNGTRTGLSNIKLWSSTDATFESGSDTYLSSQSDPGDGGSATYSISSTITTGGIYYFLTANVASDATGSIQGIIVENSSLTINSGTLSGTIVDAVLSNGGVEVPTPITLASFVANANQGEVELAWTTASETENSHFLVYRDDVVIGRVIGNGTCTDPHDYTFIDDHVIPGVHEYAISDVTYGVEAVMHEAVSVEVGADLTEASFIMNKAYPNPFNPRTVITMHYAVGSNAELNIYNTQGVFVDQLVNGYVEAGSHEIIWDAATMPSGVYLVTMQVGNTVQSQKIVLMK